MLLLGGFPESDEVVIFSFLVLPHLKNDGVQVLSHPTDCPVLLGPIRALVEIVWVRKDLLPLFEPDASFRVCSEPSTLALIEVKSQEYNSYTTVRDADPDGIELIGSQSMIKSAARPSLGKQ